MIKVLIAGFKGKMGKMTTQTIINDPELELVAVYDPNAKEQNINEITVFSTQNIPVYTNEQTLKDCDAQVWIDFTQPASAVDNTKLAISLGMSPVIGTTGFTPETTKELTQLAAIAKLPGIIVPNFSLSAVLLMKFSMEAVKYFPDVEIIEMHHNQKLDAPSGTAIRTAEMMAEVRQAHPQGASNEEVKMKGVRGGDYEGMRIHSIRLPGLIAHEQVQFGGTGEGLTIRQDSYDRSSFMAGVILATKKVRSLTGLVVGLEHVL